MDNLFSYAKRTQRKGSSESKAKERHTVTPLLSKALNLKLEVYSAIEERPKNEIVVDALRRFLLGHNKCDVARIHNLPADRKKRVTFILTEDLISTLEEYCDSSECSKTDVVIAALILFFQKEGIDPHSDPTELFRRILRTIPDECDQFI